MTSAAELSGFPACGLVGGRARLRRWRLDDSESLAEAWVDADVARWTAVPDPATPATARRWISADAARRKSGRSLDLVICTPDDDTVAGEIGLAPIDWQRRSAQVGYWINRGRRGQGLATEALGLLTDWAVVELALQLLVARCHPDNAASVAVAEAAGYGFERNDDVGHRLHVYRAVAGSC
jgi:ribosomal-protein-alanine N-acetyltransferase